jgi:hypothetical protein
MKQLLNGCRRAASRVGAAVLRMLVGLSIMNNSAPLAKPAGVDTCSTISYRRPGQGYPYRGTLQNSDYGFSAVIPTGFTGWGVFSPAPFHGFIIYLGEDIASCINFEISLHVSPPEGPLESTPRHGTRIKVGNKAGRRQVQIAHIGGAEIENILDTLGLRESHNLERPADVTITFISPRDEVKRNEPIFEEFLSGFRFD